MMNKMKMEDKEKKDAREKVLEAKRERNRELGIEDPIEFVAPQHVRSKYLVVPFMFITNEHFRTLLKKIAERRAGATDVEGVAEVLVAAT